MELSSVQHHDFDMEVHEVLQPRNLDLGPFLPPSFPPSLLEPSMVQELLNGRSSEPSVEQFDPHRPSTQANDCMHCTDQPSVRLSKGRAYPLLTDSFQKFFGLHDHYKKVCDDGQFEEAHPELANKLLDGFSDPESLIFFPPAQDEDDPGMEQDVPRLLSDEDRIQPRTRMDLPLIIRDSTIISRPDSGSEENIMVLVLAQSLHLQLDSTPERQREFRMANGNLIKAIGRTMADCYFAKDPLVGLRCCFYVFEQLISPLIMGMPFLEETQTLASNRHRLEPRMVPGALPFQLHSLDYPRRRLYCLADLQPKLANADTGSELDMMSLNYVQKRGFAIQEVDVRDSMVQFADGSLAQLVGKVQVCISIGKGSNAPYSREFYVLEGLTCDILLGEDFLNSTAAFQSYSQAFELDADDDGLCEANAIVWFNVIESNLSRVFYKNISESDHSSGKSQCWEDGLTAKIKKRVGTLFGGKDHAKRIVADLSDDDGDCDQRENHRREVARRAIARLPEANKEAALQLEQARINAYENARVSPTSQPSFDPMQGPYLCQNLSCSAEFAAQSLLE
ncbi:MAG: hypothetical protein Q9188_004949 [Gyalolechia gomerana]